MADARKHSVTYVEDERFDVEMFQTLHDSEINFRIECFWDSCWSAYLGDQMNGYAAQEDGLESIYDCMTWLKNKACEIYPDSEFATAYVTP